MHAIEMEGYLDVLLTYVECIGRLLKRLVSYAISIITFLYTSIIIRLGLVVVSAVVIYYYALVSAHERRNSAEREKGKSEMGIKLTLNQSIIHTITVGPGQDLRRERPQATRYVERKEREGSEGTRGERVTFDRNATVSECLFIVHDAWGRRGG
jgi:hypothetical protein